MKIAFLVSWGTTLVQLEIQKDVLFLEMLLCFGYCAFGFETIPILSCYLTSIVDKTRHGTVIAPFSVQLMQLF